MPQSLLATPENAELEKHTDQFKAEEPSYAELPVQTVCMIWALVGLGLVLWTWIGYLLISAWA
jgi:hypothetical protein